MVDKVLEGRRVRLPGRTRMSRATTALAKAKKTHCKP